MVLSKSPRKAQFFLTLLLTLSVTVPTVSLASDNDSVSMNKEILEMLIDLKQGFKLANKEYENKNYAEALPLYEALSSKGLDLADFKLGRMYELGLGVEVDLQKAAKFYTSASETNNVEAMFFLARFHLDGLGGLKKDHKRGIALWWKASELDHAPSAYALGSAMMSLGKIDLGYNRIRLAAFLEHPEAQLELAKMIMTGDIPGGYSDLTLAYAWTLVAKINGAKGAVELKEIIEPNLSEAQGNKAGPRVLQILNAIAEFNENK